MALTFPVPVSSFMDKLRIAEVRFWQQRYQTSSMTAGGSILAYEKSPPNWRAEIICTPQDIDDSLELEALVEAIGTERFHVYNPKRKYPRQDPDGTLIQGFLPVVYSISGDLRSIRVSGLPSGYVLSPGDMFSVSLTSGRIMLHRVVSQTLASSGGLSGTFEVTPPFVASVGRNVSFSKPTVLMRFLTDGYTAPMGQSLIDEGLSFQAVESR